MGTIHRLILKVVLGAFAAANLLTCIVTTDATVLIVLNVVVAALCAGIVLLVRSHVSGLSRELGISRGDAGRLTGDYFAYCRNVERISIDEYLARSARGLEPQA